MKKLITLLLLMFSFIVSADVYVNGYYKSNGTYVKPHYRSSPNRTVRDNYSYQGNTNPYTGSVGTRTYSNTRRVRAYSNTRKTKRTNSLWSGGNSSLWGN